MIEQINTAITSQNCKDQDNSESQPSCAPHCTMGLLPGGFLSTKGPKEVFHSEKSPLAVFMMPLTLRGATLDRK